MSNAIDGVLVKLNISQFQNSKQDGDMTDAVIEEHDLGDGAVTVSKRRFPTEALLPVRRHVSKCRKWHETVTLPWEKGSRLLPTNAIESYQNESSRNETDMMYRVGEFLDRYDHWMMKAREMHNGSFRESDYPSKEQMRALHGYKIAIEPVPTTGGLSMLVGKITQDRIDTLRRDLEESNQVRLSQAMRDVWQRILDPVMSLATRLTSQEAPYRGSLVEHLREIIAAVPTLNIVNDQQITDMASGVSNMLAGVTDEALNGSKVLSNSTAAKALEVLQQFGTYGTRSFE